MTAPGMQNRALEEGQEGMYERTNEQTNERTNVTGETLAEELDFVDGVGTTTQAAKARGANQARRRQNSFKQEQASSRSRRSKWQPSQARKPHQPRTETPSPQ